MGREIFVDQLDGARVQGWRKVDSHSSLVVYSVLVRLREGWEYSVDKRYNEFSIFHEQLSTSSKFTFDVPFPPKQKFHSTQDYDARSSYFQNFLDFVISIDAFSAIVSKFLNVPMKIADEDSIINKTIKKKIGDGNVQTLSSEDSQPDGSFSSVEVNQKLTDSKPSRKSKRGSMYFKNLMEETDMDSILEKKELTDDELLLLSRRLAADVQPSSVPEPIVSKDFQSISQELRQVYRTLTSEGDNVGILSCEQFLSWEEVENVIASGNLSKSDIIYQFELFVDRGKSGMSVRNFQLLVNQLDLMGEKEQNAQRENRPLSNLKKMSDSVINLLKSTLSAHFLFDALSSEDILCLISNMSPLTIAEGDTIIRQHEVGDQFYCMEDGIAAVFVDDVGKVGSCQRGDSFGELALIHMCMRAATVTAQTECKLWALGISAFRSVASTSTSKKIDRRRVAKTANKRISKRGSIVYLPDTVNDSLKDVVQTPVDANDSFSDIPDEIKSTFEELAKESGGDGVSLAATVSWSVMQDAIQCAFISEAIIWKEFVSFLSENSKKNNVRIRSSLSGNDVLSLRSFYQFCMRLQGIIDANIDVTDNLEENHQKN